MNASALLSLEQSRQTVAAVTGYLETLPIGTRLVALALLAELHSPYHGDGNDPLHPLLETVRVTEKALARYGALAAVFGDSAGASNQIAPFIDELRGASFDVAEFDNPNDEACLPTPRPRNGDMLFDIVRVKEWADRRNWNLSNMSWLVRAGQWGYWSLNEASRVLLCRIATASLTHRDPVTTSFTLKLGRQIGFMTLLSGDGDKAAATIGDILEAIGELPAPSLREKAWHGAMYKRFNLAVFSLCNMGAVNDVVWPTDYRFNDIGSNVATPEGWIGSRIELSAPILRQPQSPALPHKAMDRLKI